MVTLLVASFHEPDRCGVIDCISTGFLETSQFHHLFPQVQTEEHGHLTGIGEKVMFRYFVVRILKLPADNWQDAGVKIMVGISLVAKKRVVIKE